MKMLLKIQGNNRDDKNGVWRKKSRAQHLSVCSWDTGHRY